LISSPDLKYSYTYLRDVSLPSRVAAGDEARRFFNQTSVEKQQYTIRDHPEAGYRNIKNKEIYMLREAKYFPACAKLVEELHALSKQCLQTIAATLQWDPSVLLNLIEVNTLPESGYSDSCLGLNHYSADDDSYGPILGQEHEDLGLLTLVCHTGVSALEIYDFVNDGGWMDVEAAQTSADVIVMVGETLSKISNRCYLPATHRVRRPKTMRTSIVYQLRCRKDAVLDSQLFESAITGRFCKPFCISGADYLLAEKEVRASISGSY